MIDRVKTHLLRVVDAPGSQNSLPEPPAPPAPLPTVELPVTEASNATPNPPEEDRFPRVNPLKAKRVFDTPEGFGEWSIFLSGEAIKHLREFKRRDQHLFDIVQKKIKEISTGHFSADNQKRLVGGERGIQIFEAKMTGDLRLIYRIDLQTDETLQVCPSEPACQGSSKPHPRWLDRSPSHSYLWNIHTC